MECSGSYYDLIQCTQLCIKNSAHHLSGVGSSVIHRKPVKVTKHVVDINIDTRSPKTKTKRRCTVVVSRNIQPVDSSITRGMNISEHN